MSKTSSQKRSLRPVEVVQRTAGQIVAEDVAAVKIVLQERGVMEVRTPEPSVNKLEILLFFIKKK